MPTTSLQGFPYPALGDPANGPTAFQALALALEGKTVYTRTSSTRPAHLEGRLLYETDTDRIMVSDGSSWLVVWEKTPTIGAKQYVVISANQSTPLNSTTYTDLANFSFAAVNGATYAIELTAFLTSGSSTPDVKFQLAWTGSGTATVGYDSLDTTVTAPAYNGPAMRLALLADSSTPAANTAGIGVQANQGTLARLSATFACTGSGTVRWQWAQMTADATWAIILGAGSRMTVTRIA